MIWFLGDSSVRSAVQEFAGEEEFLDSSMDGALPGHIWTEQAQMVPWRTWKAPVTAVVYLPQDEYDSELTLWHVLAKVPQGSKVIYIIPTGAHKLLEGLEHFDLSNVQIVEILEGGDLTAQLRAA